MNSGKFSFNFSIISVHIIFIANKFRKVCMSVLCLYCLNCTSKMYLCIELMVFTLRSMFGNILSFSNLFRDVHSSCNIMFDNIRISFLVLGFIAVSTKFNNIAASS